MKNNSLEGIRGIASFGVLLAHLLLSLFPYLTFNHVLNSEIIQYYSFETGLMFPPIMALINGSFGVSVFFVLSGYVLTKKFYHSDDVSILQSGAVKRYPRLIVPAAVSIMFAWALLALGFMNVDKIPVLGGAGWPYGQYSNYVPFLRASYDAVIGAPIFGNVGLNNPLWTIQIELLGSLFLFASYALFGKRQVIVTFIFFTFLLVIIKPGEASQIHYYAMFSGSALNLIEPWLRRNPTISTLIFICGWLLGGFDYSVLHFIQLSPLPAPLPNLAGQEKLIFMSMGAVFLIAGILGSNFISKILDTKFPQFLARISYASYLLHWPIICSLGFGLQYVFFVKLSLGHLISSLLTCFITVPTIFIVSIYFTRYIDGPSVRFAKYLANIYWKPSPQNIKETRGAIIRTSIKTSV